MDNICFTKMATNKKFTITFKKPMSSPLIASNLIDLRVYRQTVGTDLGNGNKNHIIDVMIQLVAHTKKQIDQTTGSERRKQQFRVTQFNKAIANLRSFTGEVLNGQQAQEIPGIGKGIGERIDEIIRTGTLAELKEDMSLSLSPEVQIINQLMTITGIGEAHAKQYVIAGVQGIEDLKRKVEKKQISVTHHIEVGLEYDKDFQQRIPYQEVTELKNVMIQSVHQRFPEIMIEVCGSYRRHRPDSGDLDVLITHPSVNTDDDLINSKVHYLKEIVRTLTMDKFLVADLTSHGDTKYMGVCRHPMIQIGRRIDIRFVPYNSYYPALLYFTGSKETNKLMRTVALEKNYTLNEYGLYQLVNGRVGTKIDVHSEQEIFKILGIIYLEPIEREI